MKQWTTKPNYNLAFGFRAGGSKSLSLCPSLPPFLPFFFLSPSLPLTVSPSHTHRSTDTHRHKHTHIHTLDVHARFPLC